MTAILFAAIAAVGVAACGSSRSAEKVAGTPSAASAPPAVAGASIGAPPTPTSAWPQASYDARRSSATAALGPRSAHVRWSRQLGGSIVAGPVIGVDGTVVVTPTSGIAFGLDPVTGAIRWKTDLGQPGGSDLSSTPAVLADGTILVPGAEGDVVALSRTGSIRWRLSVGNGQLLSPAVAGGGRVYVVDMDGTMQALEPDAAGPKPLWSLSLGGSSYGSPAVAPDGTIVSTTSHSLVAVRDEGTKGVIRWSFTTAAEVEVSPAVTAAGTIILGTNGGAEYGVNSAGKQVWQYPKKQWSYSSPVANPGAGVAFGDNDGRVYIVDPATGKGRIITGPLAPSSALDSRGVGVWTSPVVDAAGNVYVGTASGHLEGFSRTGADLFDLAVDATIDSYPALGADGTLYAGATNGTFYALGS